MKSLDMKNAVMKSVTQYIWVYNILVKNEKESKLLGKQIRKKCPK